AACALSLPAAVWLGLILRSPTVGRRALTLELAGLVAAALAIAAVGSHIGESGGLIAAPVLLALVMCAFVLPERLSLFPPEAPSGTGKAFDARWLLVLVLAVCAFVAASLDPARRRIGDALSTQRDPATPHHRRRDRRAAALTRLADRRAPGSASVQS